ncbi:DEAD/DEAH box helicase [Pediococcus stilesii]|uniref:DEAD-box ATP-dependent RNA helicase CshB n=1 Tax=Pediococcus stilesii TaxID=331679 RepID=A0A0R2L2A7_9LACO|nr:DEAD/DEAH box helicase [Pediococcus stilesii]KRN93306.1 superfamily II DNA RNA helicase [Pediococcus stilesii]
MNEFQKFNLKPFLMQALDQIGFKKPTPVQEKVIPLIAAKKSVVGQSQTGSGKTHAFLLPIFDDIDPELNAIQAVITTPSRELAYQIYEDAKQLASTSEIKIEIGNYVGGTDKKRQIEKLNHHQPAIIIGTPGRVLNLLKERALNFRQVKYMVIDEADMTLDMGFLNAVDQIAASMPEKLQILVFSATIPQKLNVFLKKYMDSPVIESIPTETTISPTIKNILISTKSQGKNHLIYQLLTMGEPYLALVFTNTKERADELTDYLKGQGLDVAKIHGGIQPRERKRIMKDIHRLRYQYVIATDLAARGIDIDGVSLVINDDIPTDLEFFIHRVGRTGRNGMSGTAITLYTPNEEDEVAAVEKMGVEFLPQQIRNGELVDTYDRDRRKNRKLSQKKLDPTLIGMVKKKKKKVKPGYKRRIRKAISEKELRDRRMEQHQAVREAKKAKIKQSRSKRR